jgi:hypothetical protein
VGKRLTATSEQPVLVITARPLPDHRVRPDLARALKRMLRQHRLEVVTIEERKQEPKAKKG